MGSVRAELARHVLEMLAHGHPVPIHDAFQLRNWAGRLEDVMLSLEEVAHRILTQEENPNARGAESAWPAKRKPDLSRNTIGQLSTDESTLQKMLPGVREVQEHSCIRCGSKGYVLLGLSLDLRNQRHQLVYVRYIKQKPLFCETCCVSYCQDCVRDALKAGNATARARARIAQQLENIVWNTVGNSVIMPGFCLRCGKTITNA
jgi:hypothetical protein